MVQREKIDTRCGYIAIVGLPNVGKSTFVNYLVGTKVSIVSPKVQTTRRRVLGIVQEGINQMILIDTPGIFKPDKPLEKAIVKQAWGGVRDADSGCVMIIDAARAMKDFGKNQVIIQKLPEVLPKLFVLNKIDKLRPEALLKIIDKYKDLLGSESFHMMSALKGSGVNELKRDMLAFLPVSPWMYEDDRTTDISLKTWASEITREQVFLQMMQELPYEIEVKTDTWEVQDNGSVNVAQTIYVLKDAHKGIVIGKGGSMLKSIGMRSRKAMTHWLGQKVDLRLFVKVDAKWIMRVAQTDFQDY